MKKAKLAMTIFRELFVAEFNKNLTSKTYALSHSRRSVGFPKFEMDDSEFEKVFNVYGDDR